MELIDKAAVVVEINKLKEHFINKRDDFERGYHSSLNAVSDFIDTLEVKEVDLDSNIKVYLTNHFNVYEDGVLQSKKSSRPLSTYDIIKVAKYFFELGIKVQKGE